MTAKHIVSNIFNSDYASFLMSNFAEFSVP